MRNLKQNVMIVEETNLTSIDDDGQVELTGLKDVALSQAGIDKKMEKVLWKCAIMEQLMREGYLVLSEKKMETSSVPTVRNLAKFQDVESIRA